MSRQPQDLRPGGPGQGRPPGAPAPQDQNWRWLIVLVIVVIVVVLFGGSLFSHSSATSINYSQFISDTQSKQISSITIDNNNGVITGKLKNGTSYTTTGPEYPTTADETFIRNSGAAVTYTTPG